MTDPPYRPSSLGALHALALTLVAGAVLWISGEALPAIPSQVDDVSSWLDHHGAFLAGVTLARLLGLGVTAYLLTTLTLGVIAQATNLRRLGRVVDAVSVPLVRRALHGAAGVAFTMSAAGGAAQATTAAPPTMAVLSEPLAGVAVMHQLDPHPPPQETVPVPSPTPSSSPDTTAPLVATIAPGDHLWGVAARTLAAHWHRPPTDDEVAAYLLVIVAHNADRLAVAEHPDLVFPGQVFELPPVGPS